MQAAQAASASATEATESAAQAAAVAAAFPQLSGGQQISGITSTSSPAEAAFSDDEEASEPAAAQLSGAPPNVEAPPNSFSSDGAASALAGLLQQAQPRSSAVCETHTGSQQRAVCNGEKCRRSCTPARWLRDIAVRTWWPGAGAASRAVLLPGGGRAGGVPCIAAGTHAVGERR